MSAIESDSDGRPRHGAVGGRLWIAARLQQRLHAAAQRLALTLAEQRSKLGKRPPRIVADRQQRAEVTHKRPWQRLAGELPDDRAQLGGGVKGQAVVDGPDASVERTQEVP